MLSHEAARAKVVEIVAARLGRLQTEELSFAHDPSIALGRVLAENISADRNYPP
jgi:molybdopterin biosynthesis enzyme